MATSAGMNGVSIEARESDDGESKLVRMPTSEAEAEAMMLQSFNNDPNAIRAAAEKLRELADRVGGGGDGDAMRTIGTAVSPANSPTETEPAPMSTIVELASAAAVMPATSAVVTEVPAVAPAAVPPNANANLQRGRAPGPPPIEIPTGYLATPEGVYLWTPESWGGVPLHCIPDRVQEREGRATTILCVLVAPAYAKSRTGKIVRLPEGGKVLVYVSQAWAPVVPLTKGPAGRPILFVVPTTIDRSGTAPVVRIAQPGEVLYKFETGDGGFEYGLSISYDPDPADPRSPRLISLETLRGG